MRTKPTATYRHSGRSGHADRRSFYKQSPPLTISVEEAERIGDRAIESIHLGLSALAGAQAQQAAHIAFLLNRENMNPAIINPEGMLAVIKELRNRIRPGWSAQDVIDELRRMADELTPLTANQLVEIRAVAKSQRVNAVAECFELFKRRPEELSRRQASALIDHLKSTKRQALKQVG